MNIETANRLYELRKKNGLSQEELADKLGISRQAVSKWERAEASPDTDNLILLAKLYGITLDELLNTEDAKDLALENQESDQLEEVVENKKEEPKEKQKEEIKDDDDEELSPKNKMILDVSSGVIAISCAIAFFILGFLLPHGIGWSCYWVVFLLIPILISLIEAILKRRMTKFAYPVVVVFVYCLLGMRFNDFTYTLFNVEFTGFWHPMWILFLTIPIYYIIATPIDNYVHKENISE